MHFPALIALLAAQLGGHAVNNRAIGGSPEAVSGEWVAGSVGACVRQLASTTFGNTYWVCGFVMIGS